MLQTPATHKINRSRPLPLTAHRCLKHCIARPYAARPSLQVCRSHSGANVVSDAAVPEGHKDLHGLLYGEGGAERHECSSYEFRKGEDDGSSLIPTATYLDDREGEKPLGVYAVYDSSRNIQYVGYSRNIVLAVRAHLARVGEDRCAFVRAMVFANKAMATRANLEQEVHNWLQEFGTLPPGNGVERELWEGSSSSSNGSGSSAQLDTSAMSAAELAAYEDKKLKMRKAMGESLHDEVKGETEDAKQRRLNTIAAVEGDDWSAVIDQQTQSTVHNAAIAATNTATSQPMVSPFGTAKVHASVGASSPAAASSSAAAAAPPELPMTPEAVDKVLDEVRPYLLADGGDVEVAAVKDGVVYLTLQGSCSSCAASSVTMKMGIERALKAAYGDRLVDVVQVGQKDPAATVELVDLQLNMLRGAISSLGGSVEVLAVAGGKCELKYSGPAPIAKGISAAIKDRFPDIREVVFT